MFSFLKNLIHKATRSKRFSFACSIVGVLIIAAIIRIIQIEQLSLWRDEAFTTLVSSRSISEIIQLQINDTTPPLYSLFLHIWIQLFGVTELSLRMSSLMCSIGAIYYSLLLVKRIFSRKDVLFIGLLLSINMVSIFFAREVRSYAMLSLFISASLFYFHSCLKSFSSLTAILFVVTSVCSLYTNNLALFFILAEGLYVAIVLLRKIKKTDEMKKILLQWGTIFFAIILLWIPWLKIFIDQMGSVKGSFWLAFDPINSPQETLSGITTGVRLFTHQPFSLLQTGLNIISILLVGVATIREAMQRKSFPISFFFWIPFLGMYLASFAQPIMYVRYASFLAPIFVVAMYKGLKLTTKPLQIVLYACIAISSVVTYWSYLEADNSKPHYREMSEYIKINKNENDGILHIGSLSFFSTEYYLSENSSTIWDPEEVTPFYVGAALFEEPDFTQDLPQIAKFDRLWLIELGSISSREDFEGQYSKTDERQFAGDLYIQLWERKEL